MTFYLLMMADTEGAVVKPEVEAFDRKALFDAVAIYLCDPRGGIMRDAREEGSEYWIECMGSPEDAVPPLYREMLAKRIEEWREREEEKLMDSPVYNVRGRIW